MDMTMTDPTQDVRAQFEADPLCQELALDRMPDSDEYMSMFTRYAFRAYQAALQSPAVREMVEALEALDRLRGPFPPRDEEVSLAWAKSDAALAPFTALRTLGAGHVE